MTSCFVIMPIGGTDDLGSQQLKERYTNLIREALLKAAPRLEITRADEVAAPGQITTDIITRLMYSDLVLADITFPNPNVYYELGLRHASRPGTILIREKNSRPPPFDVQGLRHIEYTDSTSGLQQLASDLRHQIQSIASNPIRPDSTFLEHAHLTRFPYPRTDAQRPDLVNRQTEIAMELVKAPAIMKLFIEKQKTGAPFGPEDLGALAEANPDLVRKVVEFMFAEGVASLLPNRRE